AAFSRAATGSGATLVDSAGPAPDCVAWASPAQAPPPRSAALTVAPSTVLRPPPRPSGPPPGPFPCGEAGRPGATVHTVWSLVVGEVDPRGNVEDCEGAGGHAGFAAGAAGGHASQGVGVALLAELHLVDAGVGAEPRVAREPDGLPPLGWRGVHDQVMP